MKQHGTTITQFLVDGNPKGIICTYISNRTGQAIKIPRNQLNDAKNRSEVQKPCVYFLFGYSEDEENPGQKIVYIGESEDVYDRLYKHLRDKSSDEFFWDDAVIFSSKDNDMTKADIRYLEYRLIQMAVKSTEYETANKNKKKEDTVQPFLPEYSIARMEAYLDDMRIILPLFGYNLLKNPSPHRFKRNKEKDFVISFKGDDVKAYGQPTANGFTVFRYSTIKRDATESKANSYLKLRNKLIAMEIIAEKDGKLTFKEDYEFSSPSAAGAVVMGYNTNGLQAWKSKNGKPLKEMEGLFLAQSTETGTDNSKI